MVAAQAKTKKKKHVSIEGVFPGHRGSAGSTKA
jgi:hypothetical protein